MTGSRRGTRREAGRSTRTRRGQGTGGIVFLILVAWAALPSLAAQATGPAYTRDQLDCARYRQEIHSSILLQGGGARSREHILRDGYLAVRADTAGDRIALLAWFDTLTVWREGEGERISPSTDGVIGGRFRGLLSADGAFTATDRPFVPDEVAQVTDAGDALERLLPRLPRSRLAPGQSFQGEGGVVITRLSDGTAMDRPAERYRLTVHGEGEETRYLPDSTAVRARRSETETGTYEWVVGLGVVRWERSVTIDVSVPAGGVVKSAFRTRIEQQVSTTRAEGGCSAP